jgi:curved DNA-binding protein CbpA
MTESTSDPYAILGIQHDASERQVRAAYRRLAMQYHPDLHPDERTSDRMRLVNEAWHVLSSPIRRRRYDAGTSQYRAPLYPATRYAASPSVDPPHAEGPGWAGALGILVVAWLVLATVFLGFLPAPIIGLALFAGARLVLGGILRR